MSTHYSCDDTDALVAYLYDEVDPMTRDAIARHLAGCARCREDVADLGGVRQALSSWTPPAPPLRFTVAPELTPSNVVRPPASVWQGVPRWAQLVAATLALAVAAGVANVQVHRDAAGWTVTTGWMAPAAAPVAAANADWRPAVAELARAVDEIAARPSAVPAAAPAAAAPDDAAILRRVAALVDASERRQQQELARRVTQMAQDFDLQRKADYVRMSQGLGQLNERTSADLARQREMLNMIVRAGLRPPQ
ncbi:MAG: zf-HC2 domain-containing protein [Vicinamibacterales bacterium]